MFRRTALLCLLLVATPALAQIYLPSNLGPAVGAIMIAPPTYPNAMIASQDVSTTSTVSQIVATFGACNAANKGKRGMVSDALLPIWLALPVGGGAATVPIICNGSNWIYG